MVLFYHGSGANSGAGYEPIGEQLSQNYGIAAFLPDIRGHGLSDGPRGDAKNPREGIFFQSVHLSGYSS
ncbi:hypothetical protein P4H83_04455 [Paenibacillus favisporus]|uniref:serine aminopeptidase domain-containing protein n=1 Tax=Paenibacillus favisporus TaxID=221028 RepID=UPI002DB6A5EF|nr:alpha/beta hydrolase [Paenibacillus favisporus]MEC0174123.1 hypothetical protein [Paenibacillus favisporus]